MAQHRSGDGHRLGQGKTTTFLLLLSEKKMKKKVLKMMRVLKMMKMMMKTMKMKMMKGVEKGLED